MVAVNPLPVLGISLGNELARAAERLRAVTVRVHGADQGCGSGVIWNRDGMIVTNAHVAMFQRHQVELADGRRFEARVARRDPARDLAVLIMTSNGLEPAEVRDATTLRTGELVLAVGNPMGVTGAFTLGVVAATPGRDDLEIAADIRLAPGNSGGPLADALGRVVGVNSMIVNGFGVAVSSNAVARLLASTPESRHSYS